MSLQHFIGLMIVLAIVYYLIQRYVPDNTIKRILLGGIVVATVLFLLDVFFDIRGALSQITVGRSR